MPQMTVDISVGNVAEIIQSMDMREIETLYLLLTEEGKELLERKKDLELGRVKFLTRDEVFDVCRNTVLPTLLMKMQKQHLC